MSARGYYIRHDSRCVRYGVFRLRTHAFKTRIIATLVMKDHCAPAWDGNEIHCRVRAIPLHLTIVHDNYWTETLPKVTVSAKPYEHAVRNRK